MTLNHLNSDQRQYFWMSVFLAGAFTWLGFKTDGLHSVFAISVASVEAGCALAIYREWRSAPWIYLAGCCGLAGWAVIRMFTDGYSHLSAAMLVGGVFSATGFHWLRKAMDEQDCETEVEESSDLFELPRQHEVHVEELEKAYTDAFGVPQWVHHVVPKSVWLHKYADFVITMPPTENRPTWLYGTLLVSALSGAPVEFIIERPEEDTIGAIGTLSRLTEYVIDCAPLDEWNTMGCHPFFGEESSVRGLLFCKPPDSLPETIPHPSGSLGLRYVAGITEQQLETAEQTDDEAGNHAGAKALHAELRIAEAGIAHLPE